jgi:chromosome segregation ATPase
MNNNPELLKGQLSNYQEQLKSIKSYIKELNDMSARHGTDSSLLEVDLLEAENNQNYYKAEIARIKGELGQSGIAPRLQAAARAVLPQTVKQGVGALLFPSISFLVGAFLGARLQARRGGKDSRDRGSES